MAEAGAGQDAGQQDRGVVLPNYDSLTVEQRRQWCDFLIAKPLADVGKPVVRVYDGDKNNDPTRYYTFNSEPALPADYYEAVNKVVGSFYGGNKRKIMKAIDEYPFVLSTAAKFHVQPVPEQRLQAVRDFGLLLAQNEAVRNGISAIKIRIDELDDLEGTIQREASPFIVVYKYPRERGNVVDKPFTEVFSHYASPGVKNWPRYNHQLGGAGFFALGEGEIKARLKREGMLDRYYGAVLSYAYPNEKIEYVKPPPIKQLIRAVRRNL